MATKHTSRLSRRRRIVYGVIVTTVTTILLLVALESGASFLVTLPSKSFVRDAQLNHTWPPNGSVTHSEWIKDNPDFPEAYVHHYNAQGWLENYDIDEHKPAGTYRVFYLGDSFTEGCVPMERSVSSQVETFLNQTYGPDKRFEVINTGTSSYSPVLYYILLRYYIIKYKPDVIVVNVDMSDDFDDWKYRQTLVSDGEGNPVAAPPRELYFSQYIDTLEGAVRAGPVSRTQLFLAEKSHLYNLISNMRRRPAPRFDLAQPKSDFLYARWAWCHENWDAQTTENVQFTMDILGRLADYCKEQRIKMLLTGVPHYQQFQTEERGSPILSDRPHRELAALAARKEVLYFNSWKALREKIEGTAQTTYYYYGNMHFNPRGNDLWAQAHIDAWQNFRSTLLPP